MEEGVGKDIDTLVHLRVHVSDQLRSQKAIRPSVPSQGNAYHTRAQLVHLVIPGGCLADEGAKPACATSPSGRTVRAITRSKTFTAWVTIAPANSRAPLTNSPRRYAPAWGRWCPAAGRSNTLEACARSRDNPLWRRCPAR